MKRQDEKRGGRIGPPTNIKGGSKLHSACLVWNEGYPILPNIHRDTKAPPGGRRGKWQTFFVARRFVKENRRTCPKYIGSKVGRFSPCVITLPVFLSRSSSRFHPLLLYSTTVAVPQGFNFRHNYPPRVRAGGHSQRGGAEK